MGIGYGFPSSVMEALNQFSKVTGLSANMEKSSNVMARVDDPTKELLLAKTGYDVGTFPIKEAE